MKTRNFRHASFTGLIGVARADITPPVGIFCRNWAAAKHDVAEGVHRPLTLTALTLQAKAQDKPLVLVDTDLGWWRSVTTERAFRRRVLDECGLEESRFLFALSHTHSAPPLADPNPNWKGGDLLADYQKKIERATLQTVRQALGAAIPATLEWHTGRCALATNRDLPDPSSHRVVCGYNPAASADDTLLVGRVTDNHGKIIATITNYACHPTTLGWDNKLISPDFLGAMRETVEANTGGAPALFLQGASGELSPRYQYVGDPAVADAHGRQLAFSTLAALAGMEPPCVELVYGGVVESGAPLAVWKRQSRQTPTELRAIQSSVELSLKDLPSREELEKQRAACKDRVLEERLRRKRDVRQALGDGKTFEVPFWAWQIGDAILVGCMMEAYSWMQRHLRERFPDRTIVYLNLVNGSLGYLPPAELYGREVYQVWQTPFKRGSMERLAEAYETAIRSLLK